MSRELTHDKPKLFERVRDYLKDTRGELRKTTWPTRQQAINLTLIVLAVTIVMAIFLGALDFVFAAVVEAIIT